MRLIHDDEAAVILVVPDEAESSTPAEPEAGFDIVIEDEEADVCG